MYFQKVFVRSIWVVFLENDTFFSFSCGGGRTVRALNPLQLKIGETYLWYSSFLQNKRRRTDGQTTSIWKTDTYGGLLKGGNHRLHHKLSTEKGVVFPIFVRV